MKQLILYYQLVLVLIFLMPPAKRITASSTLFSFAYHRFSDIFMGVKKGTLGSGGLNRKVSQTCQPNRHFDARKIYLKYNIFDRCISHNQHCRFC